MLQDNHGRQFHYLRLSITEVCNFKCQYCLPDGYLGPTDEQFLTVPEIKTVVSAFAGLGTSKVRITGGEPSLRRDFTEIIGLCANTPGIERVAMTTHGGRLAQHAREWASAGLQQINVSIDNLDPRQFAAITGQDKLQHILKGIDIAADAGMELKVNAVLMKQNHQATLQRFLRWLKDTPITLRFIELMETGDHNAFFNEHHLSAQPTKQWLLDNGWQQTIRRKDAGPAQEFFHPDYVGKIGLIMPYSKDFCATCNRLRIAANGKLHLCLFSEQGIDIRDVIQTGDVAAVQQTLTSLLKTKDVSHYLQEGNTGATKHLAMLGG